ncbi:MAG: carotenoid oxygenase family protein [Coleofasciculaceae cyanobacterium]
MSEPIFFPKAILSVSREEFDPATPLKLTIKQGMTEDGTTLPEDLQGSVFIIAPVGSVESVPVEGENDDGKTVLPAEDGWTSLLNGDGMMYRLDFKEGQAMLSSRFVKTPSHYADKITHEKYPKLKFINLELARLSIAVGQSNQVNTAFLPMKFPGNTNERLLATWDAGRSYEIDPDSLKVIAPVGLLEDWQDLVKIPFIFPFKQMMSSAHPGLDIHTGEVFTLNVVKSLNTLLAVSNSFPFNAQKWLSKHFPDLPELCNKFANLVIKLLTPILSFVVQVITDLLKLVGIGSDDYLYLVRWDGANDLQKWPVVLSDHSGIKIHQTVHQMGVTEDYIVLADTSFKIVLEDLMPAVNPFALNPIKPTGLLNATETNIDEVKKDVKSRANLIRQYLSYPQSANTYLYIIDRQQLNSLTSGATVTAKQVTIEREFAHFLVDYNNPNGKITLNAALNTATDPAEFIHNEDTSVYNEIEITEKLQEMAGMLNNAMAINRPGFYVIDGATGNLDKEEILDLSESNPNTWYLGLYAYRDDQPTTQFEDIYWLSFGAWTNILSQFVYEMYEQYEYRQESIATILEDSKNGVPVALNRVHIDHNAATGNILTVADTYEFPRSYFASSPQFVTRPHTTGGTDGYIVCTVVHSDNLLPRNSSKSDNGEDWSNNSEIWIFDAQNLEGGPQYRLSHPQLNLGFTLHTTWLEQAAAAPTREYDVRGDFEKLVEECKKQHAEAVAQQIDQLFEEVYQEFNRDRKSE